jgi:DNA-binding MarR family transcriptional regulator
MPPASKTAKSSASGTASKPIDLGPLGERIGYRLRRAHNAVLEQGNEVFGKVGLRPPQFGILLFLDHAPGHKQSDVGEALGFQRSNFVKMIDDLEDRDLARREEAPDDKRAHVLHLTRKGKAKLRRAKKLDDELAARFGKKLGPGGSARLLKLLTKLAASD